MAIFALSFPATKVGKRKESAPAVGRAGRGSSLWPREATSTCRECAEEKEKQHEQRPVHRSLAFERSLCAITYNSMRIFDVDLDDQLTN